MTVPVTIGEEQLQSASRHPSLSYCSGQVPDRSSHHHRRILVATSGSAAVKCIRWIRRLSYETFGAISAFHVIVMATPEDIKKPDAEYIHMADQIVEISADARNSNRSVADIAISTQADAVWTGWSDDCENPELAYALHAANIQWIGPTSDVKRVLTAKSSSLTARDVDAGSGPGHLSDSHCLEQERLREFVRAHKGQRAIKRILIANNGIAAKKFLMSVRSWAYAAFGDSSMIQFVVMVTPEDLAAQADYIRLADRQVHVPGGSNHNNYANVDVITSIATSYHADAVWAGWGHASENPILADALAALNIAWIGPPSHAMRALGDKVASTLIAQCAGVHCVPWSGSGLDMKFKCGEEIDPELYKRACAQTEGDALRFAQQIGFPIMIKASAGGGGKGIRKCLKLSEVSAAFRQVQAEVPNSPIFLMRLVSNVRHVEVQLLADSQGNTIALYGRDCSIQRRHQKIIEEGPVVAVPPSIWSQMEKCAIRLAKAVGYVGAGTVEYLYDEANQEYAFLELNPRLQVEHPVTELISGVNLPAAQLQVAMGIPLDEIPAIRKLFGDSERGEIDFDNAPMVKPSGHVIACRITAENPNKGFQPTSGQLQELKFESSPNVWGYFSIGANGAVHDYADSQFGHVFAVGSSREDARRHMVSALKSMSYRGEISTTMEYLQAILETADYKNNSITTEWLESQSQTTAAAPQLSEKASVLLPAALFAWSSFSKSRAELEAKFERGLLTDCSDCVSICTQDIVLRRNGFKYSIKSSLVGPDSLILTIRSVRYGPIKVTELTGANNVVLNFEGRSFHVFSHSNNQLRVSIDGLTVTFEDEIELDLIRSEFSGKLLRFVQETGSHLNEGEVVAEIECMKMHMTLTMPANGRVELLKSPPCDISPREVLVRIDLDDPSVAQKATFSEFDGKFDVEFAPDNVTAFRKAELTLQNCLKGYAVDFECARDAIQTLLSEARNPATALEVLRETVTSFYGRVQPAIISEMFAVINKCSSSSSPRIKSAPVLPINDLVVLLNGHSALQKQLLNFSRSASSLVVSVIQSLFEQYTEIEEKFAGQDVAFTLKKMSSWLPPGSSTQYLMAHSAMLTTSSVIMHLLNVASIKLGSCAAELLPSIQRLTAIPQIARVARKAVFNIRRDRILNGDDSDSHNYVIREQMKLSRKLQTVIESPLKAEALIEVLSEISPQALNDDVVIGKLPSSSVLSGLLVAVYRESLQDLAIDLPKITSHSADTFYFLLQSDLVLSGCDDKLSSQLLDFVRQFDAQYLSSRPTTFGFIDTEDLSLHLFTFLTSNGHYSERQQLRNLAPSAISLLELERVSDEWISHSILPSIGVFTASLGKDGSRAFIRGMLPFLQEINDTNALLHVESKFDSVIHALVEHDLCPKCHHNNLFLNVIVPSIWGDVNGPIEAVIRKYAKELDRAHITSVEVRVQKQFCSVAPVARLVFTNIIGVGIVTDRYRERGSNPPTYQAISPSILSITDDHSATVPIGLNKRPNPLDGRVCNERYELPSKLDLRRDAARDLETLLPYDFLVLFSYLLQKQNPLIEHPFVSIELCRIEDAENWPRHEFDCSELNSLGLCAVVRPPGSNTISMVGWLCHVYCRSSQIYRDVVIVANDITIMRGSFGVDESDVFKRLSAYARHRRIPRLYLAANSGARIDIAADIDSIFQVDWVDPNDPSKGFNYLYLDEDDYNQNSDAVDAELIQTADGSRRYRINAVIGSHRSIGVENLAGSGRIAGETSLAYDSVFTLSYVSCRSVGIGAYLVRLGHRVIQKASDHAYLLLTGYGALNQLLGNKVYKSNMQLGGVDLMSGNGVSNQVVRNDLEGVRRMIEWLDFVPFDPAQKRHTVTTESPARPMPSTLDFVKNPYDPVMLIDGTDDIPGLFDKGSWVEINENWAKTIRCGHARLSGLSVGVIAVETRTQTKLIPADPVTSGSKDEVRVQPGCVLFPDSAYKMAQAINDFNRERLPTVILANWRGFSGGQRDMNDEILKFGSMIVDALVQAKMPVIVYLPPNAELRGGAWVVTDRNINRNVMEMYADPTSRGGILEPAGTVEIKYRNRKLDTLAARLNPEISPEHRQKIRSAYRNVAQHFVDLHDRPQRMAAVGIIDGVLPWAESRRFLYWRLRRLLLEHDLLRCCSRQALLHGLSQESDPGVCITDIALLREFMASVAVREDTEGIAFNEHCQDDTVVSWINAHEQALRNTLQRHERQIMLKRYLIDPEQCVPVAGQIDL